MIVTTVEGRNNLETLDGLLTALSRERLPAISGLHHLAKLDLLSVKVDTVDERRNRLSAHAAFEVVLIANLEFTPQELVFNDLA